MASDNTTANPNPTAHNSHTVAINLLTQLATAQFGPLAGLAVQLGAPLALQAVVARAQVASAAALTAADIQAHAAELLAQAPTVDEAIAAGEAAGGLP